VVSTGWSQTAESDIIDYKVVSGLNLIEALKYLDRNHEIKFSYNPDALKNIVIPKLPDSLSTIDAFLKISLTGTKLDYEYIADTYIIYPKLTHVKPKKNSFSMSGLVIDKNTRESLP